MQKNLLLVFFEKCKYSDSSYLLFQQLLNDTPELTFFHEIVEYGANLILIENQFILSAFNQHKMMIPIQYIKYYLFNVIINYIPNDQTLEIIVCNI